MGHYGRTVGFVVGENHYDLTVVHCKGSVMHYSQTEEYFSKTLESCDWKQLWLEIGPVVYGTKHHHDGTVRHCDMMGLWVH